MWFIFILAFAILVVFILVRHEYTKIAAEENKFNDRPLPVDYTQNTYKVSVPKVEVKEPEPIYINMPDKFEQLPLNMMVKLSYCDADGNNSIRMVTLYSIHRSYYDDDCYFKSFCHVKNEERTFKLSRVISIIEIETGEFIKDFEKYFSERFNSSPLGVISKCFTDLEAEIMVLTFVARADGVLRAKEKALIIDFLLKTFDDSMDAKALEKEIKNLACSNTIFTKQIKRVKEENKPLILELAEKIIFVDGKADPMELAVLETIKTGFSPKIKKPKQLTT